jgi:hypothetical protein
MVRSRSASPTLKKKESGSVEVSRSERLNAGLLTEAFRDVPFLLEDRFKSLGGKYEKADELWGVCIEFCSSSQYS